MIFQGGFFLGGGGGGGGGHTECLVQGGIHATIKVMGYNFNFARAIINLYTKHWAVSAENFGVSFRRAKTLCDRIYGLF